MRVGRVRGCVLIWVLKMVLFCVVVILSSIIHVTNPKKGG